MSTKIFLLANVLVLGQWACAGPSPGPASRTGGPNVLMIIADDLNANLGCYGHPVVMSPHIDRLAARGVRFDRAYCQYPLCNPSRASVLSGRRPEATGVFGNFDSPRKNLKDAVFLPEHFRKNGYFTARVGKVAHTPFEHEVSWDVSENAAGDLGKGGPTLRWKATPGPDEAEPDGLTARRVAQLLAENRDRPFFIAAGFHKPHLPFVAPKRYFDLYPSDRIQLPQGPKDDREDIPAAALEEQRPADLALADPEKRQAIAAYYACISFIDAQVGHLLDALDRLGLAQNTIVVFWGDHGFHLGEHGGLWRKNTVFEEATRAPLIVSAPGKKKGVHSQRLVEFVDLYPTFAELCGLPLPDGLEGRSFAPLLDDPGRPWKAAVFTACRDGRSVRTERYRYTEWGNRGVELYDLETDPREFVNLQGDPKHAPVVAEMKRLLRP